MIISTVSKQFYIKLFIYIYIHFLKALLFLVDEMLYKFLPDPFDCFYIVGLYYLDAADGGTLIPVWLPTIVPLILGALLCCYEMAYYESFDSVKWGL